MVLVQTYGIFRSHLDHRTSTLHGIDNAPKVRNFSIKRGGKLSLQSDVVDALVCTTIVAGSNRAQHYKLHVQRQVTQEAMPVGTDRRLGDV